MNKIFLVSIFLIFITINVLKLSANDNTYINSNNIIYNEKENIVELSKNSKINYKNTNILIDKGIIDYNKNEIEVFGNFYIYEELHILSGENLKGNTKLSVFTANNVSFIYNNDLKIDSEKLNRKDNLLYFYNNFLTPCEIEGFFNCPTWSLRVDKTEYNIEQDKFTHFDTFLQIADYKVFYLPYFSHYGSKALRKKGFLTPSIEFAIGGDQGVIIPYYVPINRSTDILFKSRISIDQNFEFIERYQLFTEMHNKTSGGNTHLSMANIKYENNENINTSVNIETKQVIDRNKIFSASGSFTNSISTTRSINEEPITFKDIYLRVENYNFMKKDDYLKTELLTVGSFKSTNLNSIPISPSLSYMNFMVSRDFSLLNYLDFTILKREESSISNPSESFKLNMNNELTNIILNNDISIFNKLNFNNSYSENYFNDKKYLNHDSFKSNMSLSSDFYFDTISSFSPRLKFIIPLQIENTSKTINEESQSISFNYQNQFSDNRFFGHDLFDSSPRTVYGIESKFDFGNTSLGFKVNQSFEAITNNSYANLINQNSEFSDYAIESNINLDNISFQVDSRLDRDSFSKKEMNYSLNLENLEKNFKFSLTYNETQSKAFKDVSSDTQSINLGISKQINKNINFSFNSSIDVKNDYDPYGSSIKVSFFDECSLLELKYSNSRFNDNYNTQPEETIGITFTMDYLGYFGYQQSTDLFFSEPGQVNYGL